MTRETAERPNMEVELKNKEVSGSDIRDLTNDIEGVSFLDTSELFDIDDSESLDCDLESVNEFLKRAEELGIEGSLFIMPNMTAKDIAGNAEDKIEGTAVHDGDINKNLKDLNNKKEYYTKDKPKSRVVFIENEALPVGQGFEEDSYQKQTQALQEHVEKLLGETEEDQDYRPTLSELMVYAYTKFSQDRERPFEESKIWTSTTTDSDSKVGAIKEWIIQASNFDENGLLISEKADSYEFGETIPAIRW